MSGIYLEVPTTTVLVRQEDETRVTLTPPDITTVVVHQDGETRIVLTQPDITTVVTGSFSSYAQTATSASYATTASYAEFAKSSIGVFPYSGSAVISGSLEVAINGITGSFKGDGSQLTGLIADLRISGSSGSDTISLASDDLLFTGSNGVGVNVANNKVTISIPQGVVSSSAQAANWLVQSASYAENAATLGGNNLATFATSGSNIFIGTQTITGSVSVTNGITGSLFGTASHASFIDGGFY